MSLYFAVYTHKEHLINFCQYIFIRLNEVRNEKSFHELIARLKVNAEIKSYKNMIL